MSMKQRLFVLLLITIAALAALACTTTTVEIPPGHVGKLQTKSGLSETTLEPGLIKLANRCAACDNVIIAEVTDFAAEESMSIFMPKDQLNLLVEVRGVYAIDRDKIDSVYLRIAPQPLQRGQAIEGETTKQQRVTKIFMSKVYTTYAQQVVREATRSFLTQFTIDEVMSNRQRLGDELWQNVQKKLEVTPVEAIIFGFADIQPPGIIVTANEQRREREIAIDRAEANKQVSLTEAEAALEVAKKQQEVDLVEATTQVLVQEKLNEAVNPAFTVQRYLKFLDKVAENKNAIFVPIEALQSPGLSFRIFSPELAETLRQQFAGQVSGVTDSIVEEEDTQKDPLK